MKKIYFVRWEDINYLSYSTLVLAKNEEHAWRKVRRRHPCTTCRVISVTEQLPVGG